MEKQDMNSEKRGVNSSRMRRNETEGKETKGRAEERGNRESREVR